MRNQQKQINILLLFSLALLLLPTHVLAIDGEGKGKMQIKTDRIFEEQPSDQKISVTELDKVFPSLFTEKVTSHLEQQQMESTEQYKKLKQEIFDEAIPNKTTLYDVKQELFTEEYTSTYAYNNADQDDTEQQAGVSGIIFFGTVAVIVGVIFSGVFMLIRNF